MQAAAKCCERMWNCVWSGINISFFFQKKKRKFKPGFCFYFALFISCFGILFSICYLFRAMN